MFNYDNKFKRLVVVIISIVCVSIIGFMHVSYFNKPEPTLEEKRQEVVDQLNEAYKKYYTIDDFMENYGVVYSVEGFELVSDRIYNPYRICVNYGICWNITTSQFEVISELKDDGLYYIFSYEKKGIIHKTEIEKENYILYENFNN